MGGGRRPHTFVASDSATAAFKGRAPSANSAAAELTTVLARHVCPRIQYSLSGKKNAFLFVLERATTYGSKLPRRPHVDATSTSRHPAQRSSGASRCQSGLDSGAQGPNGKKSATRRHFPLARQPGAGIVGQPQTLHSPKHPS